MIRDLTNRPLAAAGLISYRYMNDPCAPVMIGARNDADALNEARRSVSGGQVDIANLQRWNGQEYVPVRRLGSVCIDGWAGRAEHPVEIVDETPKRYRVRIVGDPRRIAGKLRDNSTTFLVPKRAVRLEAQ